MSTQVSYAFYSSSAGGHNGDDTYAGKSDGLDRKYFGPSFAEADKMAETAKKNGANYRLEKLTYEHPYQGSPELRCKVETIKVWPLSEPTRKAGS